MSNPRETLRQFDALIAELYESYCESSVIDQRLKNCILEKVQEFPNAAEKEYRKYIQEQFERFENEDSLSANAKKFTFEVFLDVIGIFKCGIKFEGDDDEPYSVHIRPPYSMSFSSAYLDQDGKKGAGLITENQIDDLNDKVIDIERDTL